MQNNTANPDQNGMLQVLKEVHLMYVKQQVSLLEALKAELGTQVAEIVERVHSGELCRPFRELAQKTDKNTIEDLIATLWEPLREKRYEFTVEHQDDGVQIYCTSCPLANLYRFSGGAEWGYRLYCAADDPLVEAFNSHIGLKRTKTLMEGHDCCDHFYYIKD